MHTLTSCFACIIALDILTGVGVCVGALYLLIPANTRIVLQSVGEKLCSSQLKCWCMCGHLWACLYYLHSEYCVLPGNPLEKEVAAGG